MTNEFHSRVYVSPGSANVLPLLLTWKGTRFQFLVDHRRSAWKRWITMTTLLDLSNDSETSLPLNISFKCSPCDVFTNDAWKRNTSDSLNSGFVSWSDFNSNAASDFPKGFGGS